MRIICRSPAKINLALHVTGQREDNYHLIDTLVVFTAFGDELVLSCPDNIEHDQLQLSGPFCHALPDNGDNLVLRAVAGLRELLLSRGVNAPAVRIELQKNLPISSGIGGGSANAAASLRGLSRLWNISDDGLIQEVAVKLGADIPMCIKSRTLRARGIGEQLERLAGNTDFHLLLVNPGVSIATMDVFRSLNRKDNSPIVFPETNSMPSIEMMSNYRNDLQEPAIISAPIILTVLNEMNALPAIRFCRMSGSGATCFGIFDTPEAAENAAQILATEHPDWWIKPTRLINNEEELDCVIQ